MGVVDSVIQHERDDGGGVRGRSDPARRLKSPADPVPPVRSRDGATALMCLSLLFGPSCKWLEACECVGACPNVMVLHQRPTL